MVRLSSKPVAAVFVTALLSLSGGDANACSVPDELSVMRREVIGEINQKRRARGLPLLAPHGKLTKAAQGHACWISDKSKTRNLHKGRGGSTLGHRVRAQGYRYSYVNENVGGVSGNLPGDIVNRWMNSPAHRKNILSPRPRHIGIGIAEGRGWRFWVMVGANS